MIPPTTSRRLAAPRSTQPDRREHWERVFRARCRVQEIALASTKPRSASSRGTFANLTALRTAEAISRCAPASVPSSVVSRPSISLIFRPTSSNRSSDAPTVGMASVTSAIRSEPFAANAARTSGIDMDSVDDKAGRQPTFRECGADDPGSRALIGGIALNRCVTPVAPSSVACMTTMAVASL